MLSKIFPYGCLNIDCSWSQWMTGVRKAMYSSEDRSLLSSKISCLFSQSDNVIVTVCVRTAFDFFLKALSLPKGSEVLMTSINIPEMTRILRKHGLIPVPVDIDVNTLETPLERIEKSITPRTKLIMITMLYGVTYDIKEISKFAKAHNLPVFEDCAECYSGNSYIGSELADATVLSFGPIKTATAFGGGVIIVRNPELLSKMRAIHSSYPVQSSSLYLKKLIKYTMGMMIANSTKINYLTRYLLFNLNIDHKKFVVKMMRGFPASTGLEIYQFQPCSGLLSFLHWRLTNFDENDLFVSMAKMKEATNMLSERKVLVPGFQSTRKVFWLYPVIVDNPSKAYIELNRAGIDAYRGISQLNKIEPPVGNSFQGIKETDNMFNNLLYFPLHKDVPEDQIKAICLKAIEVLKPTEKI